MVSHPVSVLATMLVACLLVAGCSAGGLAAVLVLLPGPVSSLDTGLLIVVGVLLGVAVIAVAALARVPGYLPPGLRAARAR